MLLFYDAEFKVEKSSVVFADVGGCQTAIKVHTLLEVVTPT